MTNQIIRQYAECVSGGAITEPTGGTWISAIAIWQGSTEPLNGSWIQRICDNFGITEPLHGSWIIALANYYGQTEPVNGTWSSAVLIGCGVVPTDLIWNETFTDWDLETTQWKTAVAPVQPTITTGPDYTVNLPLFQGTAEANNPFVLTVNGDTYNGVVDGTGNWSLQTTTTLPGVPGGTPYTVDIFTTRASDGLTSATLSTPITITLTTVLIVVQMGDLYGDGMNNSVFEVEKEVTPGVWQPQEYDGNPYRYDNQPDFDSDLPQNRRYYKTDSIGNRVSGIYGLRFETFEYGVSTGGVTPFPTGGQVWLNSEDIRTITLEPGFNYRTVVQSTGDYPSEVYYDLKKAGNIIASQPGNSAGDWAQGNIQTTFTL